MQDLLGRLTALDPDASETLKVVTYFDALVARSVGVESMLRGAAVLSGATVGQRDGRQIVRVRADGVRIDPIEPSHAWPVRESGPGAIAWIEREGPAHTNDTMILERLSLALGIIRARRSVGPESAVELAISSYAGADERAAALPRLRLGARTLRLVASPPDPAPLPQHPSAVVATRHGLTRATILDAETDAVSAWPDSEGLRLGLGTAGPGEHLPRSWSSALVAVRLTSPAEPVVDVAELGALLLVAEAAEASGSAPSGCRRARRPRRPQSRAARRRRRGAERARRSRSAWADITSSVQERLTALVEGLGYDPRTSRGHARYVLARMLLTLGS